MAKVFIDGEAGTTGLGIRDRLKSWPEIQMISLPEATRKSEAARLDAMKSADLVVLCLPDDAAREAAIMVSKLGSAAPKLLDASSAHRTAAGWVYGFPELSADAPVKISQARLVSNPGCYATGAIALLQPLIAAGLVDPGQDITINAVSGYSGGGKTMIASHDAEGGPAFELYGLGLNHKHVPEIMAHAGLSRRPIFVPSVGHFRQGMLVSIPLFLDRLAGRPSAGDIAETFAQSYGQAGRVFCHHEPVQSLAPQDQNNSDRLALFVCANEPYGHVVLIAQLDNLGKGASGAAVQNIALMLGLEDKSVTVKELANG